MVNKQSGKEGTPKLIHQAPPCGGGYLLVFLTITSINEYNNQFVFNFMEPMSCLKSLHSTIS